MSRPLPECSENEMLLPAGGFHITPSNINPWRGARHPDNLFTGWQMRTMPLYQLDPATCDYVVVRSSVSQAEYWWPSGTAAPVYLCPCPIVSRRADGSQLLVISPAGMKKWVYADGAITRRKPSKYAGRRNFGRTPQ